ncbi:hypothetical protein [Niabella sp.]|uniref:DUF6934 family protein n=1 Tax=Niabella sp. TaxID=1962976 RepID=UPI002610253E|nr:hypothetical protein [Niabella sp.]
MSTGRSCIEKVVEFSPTAMPDIYNLGFGDLCPDGTMDDAVNSNNGDIIKVLATVIRIIRAFTQLRPHIKIMFAGSTPERQRLYQRILKMYHAEFVKEFIITGLIEDENLYKELFFNPQKDIFYLAFFIKRIY